MKELIILLFIGISLSIDTFSVSTIIGITNKDNKNVFKISLLVGIFHFIMPLIGLLISNIILKYLNLNTNIILGIILILISLQMFIEYLNPSNKDININKQGLYLFALGVSLDSFSVGLGLNAITNNLLLASTIFSVCSFSFTYLGLSIGKYINKLFNKYSYLIGTIMLFIIGLLFLLT